MFGNNVLTANMTAETKKARLLSALCLLFS